jgi:hypothetical protein
MRRELQTALMMQPDLASAHRNPRFAALLKKVGFDT